MVPGEAMRIVVAVGSGRARTLYRDFFNNYIGDAIPAKLIREVVVLRPTSPNWA